MKHNIYLPDELGARAKADDLPLSQMLQGAVRQHYLEADAMSATLQHARSFELPLEDDMGRPFTGRLVGTQIAQGDSVMVFLAEDGRVIVYDGDRNRHHEVTDDPEEGLRAWLPEGAYIDAMHALGLNPIIDL